MDLLKQTLIWYPEKGYGFYPVEDMPYDEAKEGEFLGFQTLDNGMNYLGMMAGGDWEYPVYFVIYWDGRNLRAYIPTEGNLWNTKAKIAYGNDEEDGINILKRFGTPEMKADFKGRVSELEIDDVGKYGIDYDFDKMKEDVQARIIEK